MTAIALPLEIKPKSKSQWTVVWEQFQKQPQAIFALLLLLPWRGFCTVPSALRQPTSLYARGSALPSPNACTIF